MKKQILLIMIILLLSIFTASASTLHYSQEVILPTTADEAIDLVNQHIEQDFNIPSYYTTMSKNGSYSINKSSIIQTMDLGFNAIIYGEPSGLNQSVNQHRYWGYTRTEELFINPHHPFDAWAGGYIEDNNWIIRPWYDERVKDKYKIQTNYFNSNIGYNEAIYNSLKHFYGDIFKGEERDWYQYVHIQQPPTDISMGLGVMYNERPSGIWYMSVSILPLKAELEAFNTPDSSPITETVLNSAWHIPYIYRQLDHKQLEGDFNIAIVTGLRKLDEVNYPPETKSALYIPEEEEREITVKVEVYNKNTKEIISTNSKEYSIELTTEKPIASTVVDFTLETHQYAKITYSHLVIDGGTTGEAKEIFYHIGDVPTGLNSYNLLTADEASSWLNLDRYGWDIGITHY